MTTRAKSNLRLYEKEYPFKVEMPERPLGYGSQLNVMVNWCRDNASDFEVFGGRFYFKSEADALDFRAEWLAGC